MKLAVLAYHRSGSSLLYRILRNHVDCHRKLDEVFNPSERNILVEHNGDLAIKYFPDELTEQQVQSREYRLALMKQYDHRDYFAKIFGIDVSTPAILEYLLPRYKFVTIERRNTFDSVLSALIASHYWYFNDRGDNPAPDYQPFVAEYSHFQYTATAFKAYFNNKEILKDNIISSLVYEDIVDKSRREILEMAGFPGIEDNEKLPLRKLLSFEEKYALIENIEQVAQWYQEELTFFIPGDR